MSQFPKSGSCGLYLGIVFGVPILAAVLPLSAWPCGPTQVNLVERGGSGPGSAGPPKRGTNRRWRGNGPPSRARRSGTAGSPRRRLR